MTDSSVPRDYSGSIGKARAAAVLLDLLHDGDSWLRIPYTKMSEDEKAEIREWWHLIAYEALKSALDDIEDEQRAAAPSSEPAPEPPSPEEGPRLHVVKTGGV